MLDRTPRLAAFTALIALVAACGDSKDVPMEPDAGMGVEPEYDEEGCRILKLGTRDFSFNLFDQLLGVKFPVTPNLDGERRDLLHVELWDSTTEGLPPLAKGTFDLSTNTDLATCQHCVWVELDATDDGLLDSVYVATAGMLTLDKVSDPLDAVFAGASSRVVLRRAMVGENSATTLVPGGDCVSIAGLTFDTSLTPGAQCESAEDCGNAILEVCNPFSNTCTPPECNFDSPCPDENQVCLVQYGNNFEGACYTTCNPSTQTGCTELQECVQRGVDASFGICKTRGEGALGEDCEIEDNSTSCVNDAQCSVLSETCTQSCSFFAADTGCAAGTQCTVFNSCETLDVGINVPDGVPCGPNAYLAQACAPDGEAFRGICFAYPGDALRCEETCLGEDGCGAGEFCGQRFSSGLGICLPNPVCGDGELGEINEICDDGNETDGDGCSDNCQTVGFDYLCDRATALGFGVSMAGNTEDGIDGFQATCQPGIAKAALYEVTPPGPGKLTLHLTSPTSQALSVRAGCTDVANEQYCEGELGSPTDKTITIQVTDTIISPISVMVSAMTLLEQGSYTISAEFVDEDCGDGIVAGREVCDDMDQDSNDGCSSDCRTIEYNYYCTASPTLSTSSVNTGTLVGAPLLYEATCDVDAGAAIHPSRLYTYTAPSAGTLHLALTDGTSFAVLSVRDGCDEPASSAETACRPAFLDGMLDIELAANETISVVVSTYFPEEGLGTYTLEASFTP